ncbi:MAG: SUMF1/EgtB/PvdO family nonheme iron enzyme [Cyanobacteria bacterium P01_A01_bin.135]
MKTGLRYAIAIGINHYHNLQPLRYAQQDANRMRQFFREDMGFEQVYYFSDDSPPIPQDYGPKITSQPTYATLRRFLRVRFEKPFLRAGDNFWFFFAGHGVRHQDRDYLMPLDADPGDIEGTSIPLSYVAERLRRCGADNVVMLVDACRSQGRRDGLGIGSESQQGVITLFSCSPHESSYEIEALEQGSFTYALLQAMRRQGEGNCATVERLDQHLRYQVPKLNRQYNKPEQTPYAVVEPAAKYHLILLPQMAAARDVALLKLDAFKAENVNDLALAEQLWVRVLSMLAADPDAIEGIRRVDRLRGLAQPAKVQHRLAAGDRPSPPRVSHPHSPISRRRLLQLSSGLGAGLGAIALGRVLGPVVSGRNFKQLTESIMPGPNAEGPGTEVQFEVVTVTNTGEIAETKRQAAPMRTEVLGNGIDLELMSIAAGRFTMGSPQDEAGREESEGPQHEVAVPAFEMGRYLVTQAQWQAVAALPKVNQDLQVEPERFEGNSRPARNVSFNEAVEFCDRLSSFTGRQYRLPSEAEWEYACRAGTTTPFHFGPTITTDLANYDGDEAYGAAPKGLSRDTSTEVGNFPPNAFGLYDMHGNMTEWCADAWHDDYRGAPEDGSVWLTGGDTARRLARGGSFSLGPARCRSASRLEMSTDGSSGLRDSGFRVVCEVSGS